MKDIFIARNIGYNLWQGNDSQLPKVYKTNFGVENVSFLGNRLWWSLLNVVKEPNSLSVFKGTH